MKFLLESDGTLKFTKSLNNEDASYSIVGHNVLIYDYIINDNQSIHIIYLQKDGSLYYKFINNENITESKMSKFDVQSNIYNKMSILNTNNKLNLIYSFYNIMNPNVHTIHHIILTNNSEEKYNVIKFVSKNIVNSFVVDNDSNTNIHLFYNTISQNFSYIYYTYFNPYKNQWLTNPMRLSSSDSHSESPSIFVDHMDNIHGIWWEKNKNGYKLRYKRMSTLGTEMYKWKEITIPSINQDKAFSNIYEINNNLYIECSEYVLISNNLGLSWIKDEKEIKDNVTDGNVLNNITQDDLIANEKTNESQPENNTLTDESSQSEYEITLLNQEEILNILEDILHKQEVLESKFLDIENILKEQNRSGFKKLFFN